MDVLGYPDLELDLMFFGIPGRIFTIHKLEVVKGYSEYLTMFYFNKKLAHHDE